MPALSLTVNGRAVATQVEPTLLLVDLLRGPLALTARSRAATRRSAAPAPCLSTAPR